jgi:probable HAF family extracellular repeat protein
VNNAGQVAGRALTATLVPRAISWNGTAVTNLGGVGPLSSAALGISSTGVVVGYKANPGTGATAQAARWENGQLSYLQLPSGYVGSFARDANANNQIAGWLVVPNGDARGTMWTDGQAATLPNTGGLGSYWAFAINQQGHVIGRRTAASGATQAVIWKAGVLTTLPDLGGNYASPTRINDAGMITGGVYVMVTPTEAELRPVVWTGPTHQITEIASFPGGLFSTAEDINVSGQIVGKVDINLEGGSLALIWPSAGSAPINLNTLIPRGSDWILQRATAVNDAGMIVGWGTRAGLAGQRSFLLTPGTAPSCVAADLNCDGSVNGVDVAILRSTWTGAQTYAPCPPPQAADLNQDCKVNGQDLAILLAAWNP